MVHRQNRQALLTVIENYLSGQLKSFDFDERLDAINTEDHTVHEIAFILRLHHDHLIDHRVRLTRWSRCWGFALRVIA